MIALPRDLIEVIPRLVETAQTEYDAWEQNERGFDEELGYGGVCDKIALEFGEVLSEHGFDVMEGVQVLSGLREDNCPGGTNRRSK